MKPKIYNILSEAVESGVKYGIYRAHKHTEDPDRDTIQHEVVTAVLQQISEYFSFDDEINISH